MKEYLPCEKCELPYCFLDRETFEKPLPIDACWELYDSKKSGDAWRFIIDRYVAQKKVEQED